MVTSSFQNSWMWLSIQNKYLKIISTWHVNYMDYIKHQIKEIFKKKVMIFSQQLYFR